MRDRLSRAAWAVLGWNVAVILWGAYVRATGSGAGCGAHWPLCNGEIVPRAPTTEMLVEFSHRVTSGLALISVAVLVLWTWRDRPAGHPARRAAAWAMAFMITEAAVGAALVLFRLVADNASMARAMFMSVHLMNTFALLASLTVTAWFASTGAPSPWRNRSSTSWWLAAGVVALTISGISGAVAALGDTLYPAGSLTAGFAADLSATSHLLIRLRVLHPIIAVFVAFGVMVGAQRVRSSAPPRVARAAQLVAVATGLQVAAGFLNVLLLAPVWMQIVHLLFADAVWISYVLLGAELLSRAPLAVARQRIA